MQNLLPLPSANNNNDKMYISTPTFPLHTMVNTGDAFILQMQDKNAMVLFLKWFRWQDMNMQDNPQCRKAD